MRNHCSGCRSSVAGSHPYDLGQSTSLPAGVLQAAVLARSLWSDHLYAFTLLDVCLILRTGHSDRMLTNNRLTVSIAPVGYAQDSITALVARGSFRFPRESHNRETANFFLSLEDLQQDCAGSLADQVWCQRPDTAVEKEKRLSANLRAYDRLHTEYVQALDRDGAEGCRKDQDWVWSTDMSQCRDILGTGNSLNEFGNVILITNLTDHLGLFSVGIRRPEVERSPLGWPTKVGFSINTTSFHPPYELGRNLGINLDSHLRDGTHWYPTVKVIKPMKVIMCGLEKREVQCAVAVLGLPLGWSITWLATVQNILAIWLLILVCGTALKVKEFSRMCSRQSWVLSRSQECAKQLRRLPAASAQAPFWLAKYGIRLVLLYVIGLILWITLHMLETSTQNMSQPWKPWKGKSSSNAEIEQMKSAGTTDMGIAALANNFLVILMTALCVWIGWTSLAHTLRPLPIHKGKPRALMSRSSFAMWVLNSRLFGLPRFVLRIISSTPQKPSSVILVAVLMVNFSTGPLIRVLETVLASSWLGWADCKPQYGVMCPVEVVLGHAKTVQTLLACTLVATLLFWASRRLHTFVGLSTFTSLAIWSLVCKSASTQMVRINNAAGEYDRYFVGHKWDGGTNPWVALVLGLVMLSYCVPPKRQSEGEYCLQEAGLPEKPKNGTQGPTEESRGAV